MKKKIAMACSLCMLVFGGVAVSKSMITPKTLIDLSSDNVEALAMNGDNTGYATKTDISFDSDEEEEIIYDGTHYYLQTYYYSYFITICEGEGNVECTPNSVCYKFITSTVQLPDNLCHEEPANI